MQRQAVDGQRIFTISDFFSAEECRQHVTRSEELGFETFTIGGEVFHGYRDNARVLFEDPELAESLWQRVANFLPSSVDSLTPCALSPRFRYYRYTGEESFAPHADGVVRLGERTSRLTFLVYLTEVAGGGQTRFYDNDLKVSVEVAPALGKALVFEHPILHEGVAVEHGTKYVLRTDVLCEGNET